ncbi:MAG: hypothetical protein ACLU99_04215 [Alphaproteobacteria bacterium]
MARYGRKYWTRLQLINSGKRRTGDLYKLLELYHSAAEASQALLPKHKKLKPFSPAGRLAGIETCGRQGITHSAL